MMKRHGLLLFSVLLLSSPGFLAEPARAQTAREEAAVVDIWKGRLEAAEAHIRGGEYRKARRSMHLLLWEMSDRIQSGPGAAPLLGTAALFRGLAEAGLGNGEAAAWDWFIAQAL